MPELEMISSHSPDHHQQVVKAGTREDLDMPYELRILTAAAGTELSSLIGEARAAIAAGGFWERFVEVRMAAGPTVRVTSDEGTGFEVTVSWGSQHAQLKVRTLAAGIECADRLAYLFYEMRNTKLVRDLKR